MKIKNKLLMYFLIVGIFPIFIYSASSLFVQKNSPILFTTSLFLVFGLAWKLSAAISEQVERMTSIYKTGQVEWMEVAKQKERELEGQKKNQDDLRKAEREAEREKEVALHSMALAQEMAAREKKSFIELQQKVDSILSVVKSAQNGDLTQDITVSGDDALGQLAFGLKKFFGQLSVDLNEIDKMTRALQDQAAQMNNKNLLLKENSGSSFEKSVKMKEKTEKVTNNIKNLNHSIHEMKQAVNEIAKQASESSRFAGDAVGHVTHAKELGKKLQQSAEDISRFVEVINTIARQTNLLALNATIEAARAGDAGKGFAVVANEVKELARQSGDSAGEITEKVSTIKENTENIMGAIYKVSDLMDNINNSARIVASATEEQFATSEQLISIAGYSVKEMEEIDSGTNVIRESSGSSHDIVRDSLSVSSELGLNAERFGKLLSKFKFKNVEVNTSNDYLRKAS